MKEVLLVLLGAFISCGTTWLLDWLKSEREEKAYYRKKKEETYLEMIENIDTFICADIIQRFQPDHATNLSEIGNDLRAKSKLYAKKEIASEYYRLMRDLIEDNKGGDGFTFAKWDKLVSDIKEDLNITE